MGTEYSTMNRARVTLENANDLNANDLSELCDATEEAIKSGGGFGWLTAPPRNILEDYWRGVLLIPERSLILGKVDMVIAGSCQIVRPPKANEAQDLDPSRTSSARVKQGSLSPISLRSL